MTHILVLQHDCVVFHWSELTRIIYICMKQHVIVIDISDTQMIYTNEDQRIVKFMVLLSHQPLFESGMVTIN